MKLEKEDLFVQDTEYLLFELSCAFQLSIK